MYDRLNVVGVCLSYNRSLVVSKTIGGHFTDILHKLAATGKRLRFIGDNLNISVGVAQERLGHHKHMVHMFASAVLASDHYFMTMAELPEIPLHLLKVKHMVLSETEYHEDKRDCVCLIGKIKVPQLAFIRSSFPKDLAREYGEVFTKKTDVIHLPVLPFHEQCYRDDVKILDYYEHVTRNLIERGCLDENVKIQIGGGQLTRERFSNAKLLCIGNFLPPDRFALFGPVTFEFFHLAMNFFRQSNFQEIVP